jgi:hypothetical protein
MSLLLQCEEQPVELALSFSKAFWETVPEPRGRIQRGVAGFLTDK